MKFKLLSHIMAEVLQALTGTTCKILAEHYEKSTKEDCSCWYVVYNDGGDDKLLVLPKNINATGYYILKNTQLLRKDFFESRDKTSYIIDRKDVICHYEGGKFAPLECYDFISVLKKNDVNFT